MGKAHGQFSGLGVLLPPLLKHDLDPDWERFLGTFLLSRGENVRNLVAHGFTHDISRDKTALLLRAGALLILIAGRETSQRDANVVKAALANPTGTSRMPWPTVSSTQPAPPGGNYGTKHPAPYPRSR
jgi:hypothetical protein